MQSSDLTFANLECALSHRGSPVPGKAFTFRGSPEAIPHMREAGVDVVSLANNHTRDYGAEAMVDTLACLDQNGVAHGGSGANYSTAHEPAYIDAQGLRVAFLAYSYIGFGGWSGWWAAPGYPGVAYAGDTAGMVADVQAAGSNSDLVVVSFHWGIEKDYTPNAREINLARLAVDSGADLILGHHPHVVQGFEIYKGKLIAYSLGNFVFNPGSAECRYTILTQIQQNSEGFLSATIYPVYISGGRPSIMGGSEAQSLLSRVAGMSAGLGMPITVGDGVAHIP